MKKGYKAVGREWRPGRVVRFGSNTEPDVGTGTEKSKVPDSTGTDKCEDGWQQVGDNTGPSGVWWCSKCGKIADGHPHDDPKATITYPEMYEMEGCPMDHTCDSCGKLHRSCELYGCDYPYSEGGECIIYSEYEHYKEQEEDKTPNEMPKLR